MFSLLFWIALGLSPLAGCGAYTIYSRCRVAMEEKNVTYLDLANDESIIVKPSFRPPFPEPKLQTLFFTFLSTIILCTVSLFLETELPKETGFMIILATIIFIWSATFDITVFRLPDELNFISFVFLIIASITYAIFTHSFEPILYSVAAGLLYVAVWLFPLAVSGGGMLGFGDIKLSLPLGVLLGITATSFLSMLTAVLLAAFVGSCMGIVGGVASKLVKKGSIQYPFGPYLILGALIVFML